jgi:hypothetical protein
MTIERINTECYQKFLVQTGQKRWKAPLTLDVTLEIIQLTENHPYYVNALCRHLWKQDGVPTLGKVRSTWQCHVEQQSPWIISDLDGLTLNRKKVLHALAHHSTNEPQGHSFSKQAELSPSGIRKSLDDLLKLDLIYQDKNGYYQVLDPAVAYFLREHT